MIKTITTIALVLGTMATQAQQDYKIYTNGTSAITVETGSTQGNMYLEVEDIGIRLRTSRDRHNYVALMEVSYAKYTEWKDIAIANGVTSLNKEISHLTFDGYFQYGGEWFFGSVDVRTGISIHNGVTRMFVYFGEMEASSNQFINSESFVISMDKSGVNELKGLMEEGAIRNFISAANNKTELFK